MEIAPGEFLALLGPSGSGKSTILMMLAGFERPDKGRILFGSSDYTRVPPHKRNIGMVFQHYTLFPNMTVLDNVAFPLKTRGVPKKNGTVLPARHLLACDLPISPIAVRSNCREGSSSVLRWLALLSIRRAFF